MSHTTPASAHHCATISPYGTTGDDDDCDGYTKVAELYINTDPIQACARTPTPNDEPTPGLNAAGLFWNTPLDAWAYDLNDDQFVNGQDILKYNPVFGMINVYGPPYSRYDLNMDHLINGQDILRFNHVFGANCSFIPLNKNIVPYRWYHQLVCNPNCDYTSWMTLDDHRVTSPDDPQHNFYPSRWNTAIDTARAAWDVTPNTTYIQQFENPDPTADIHFYVDGEPCWTELSFSNYCFTGPGAAATWWIGPSPGYEHYCGYDCPQPQVQQTIWYAISAFREDEILTIPDVGFQAIARQSTAAHEMGHVLGLGHDQSVANPEVPESDHECVKATIMDYDCYQPISPTTHQLDVTDPAAWANVIINPQGWDSCGVNHEYYDPNWGYSGC